MTRDPHSSTSGYPASVDRLLAAFEKLPGIGRRSAERLAFHVLKSSADEALALARAIEDVKSGVRHCTRCFNFADGDLCSICADPARDHALVLVVEQPKDLFALESTGMHRGSYHVLLGRISPLDGVGPEDITAAALLKREPLREVILGLSPTLEGDGTALYLAEQLRNRGGRGGGGVAISRLARGLPAGRELEFANKAALADALEGRQSVN
ncbi:MAG: recombination mediator RecR [Phycisphaerales bacterium]